jgi:DNA-binding response OmpR family regulator
MKILLVDPDESFAALTSYALRRHGHQAFTATQEEEAWRRWSREQYDLVLLDPAASGNGAIDIVRRIRDASSIPIIVLSSLNGDADFVRAFESGVDDYIVKPFSIRQLVVRIQTLLRHMRQSTEIDQRMPAGLVTCGDLTIDASAFEVYKNGTRVGLTKLELRILYFLALNARRVVETQRLADYSWQSPGAGDARLLKTHICHIRRKLTLAGGQPLELCAIPRTGYVLTEMRSARVSWRPSGDSKRATLTSGRTSHPTATTAAADTDSP